MSNIMIIGAHPDDIEFGCGGTVANHVAAMDNVHMVVMTNSNSVNGITGNSVRSKSQYSRETMESKRILDVTTLDCLPFTDLRLEFNLDTVSALEKLIGKYKINTIYTHWEGDANQDHIATFNITMAAGRLVPNIYCYEQIPMPRLYTRTFVPNYYIDITNAMNIKLESCNAHQSQIVKYKLAGYDIIKNLNTLAKYHGIQADVEYAEAFNVIKQVKK